MEWRGWRWAASEGARLQQAGEVTYHARKCSRQAVSSFVTTMAVTGPEVHQQRAAESTTCWSMRGTGCTQRRLRTKLLASEFPTSLVYSTLVVSRLYLDTVAVTRRSYAVTTIVCVWAIRPTYVHLLALLRLFLHRSGSLTHSAGASSCRSQASQCRPRSVRIALPAVECCSAVLLVRA
jgi:hypothetical protein